MPVHALSIAREGGEEEAKGVAGVPCQYRLRHKSGKTDQMPAKPGKDGQVFIELFVRAYENFAWVGSKIDRLD